MTRWPRTRWSGRKPHDSELDNVKVGELRPSQMMSPFGIGSIIDLPFLSVIVLGLDYWKADRGVSAPITEDRLLRAVQWRLGQAGQGVAQPAHTCRRPAACRPASASRCAVFPRWMVCSRCHLLARSRTACSSRKPTGTTPTATSTCMATAWLTSGKRQAGRAAGPLHGRLRERPPGRLPLVRLRPPGPSTCKATFYLQERGTSGEARDVWVKCATCEKERPLSDAFGFRGQTGDAQLPRAAAPPARLR